MNTAKLMKPILAIIAVFVLLSVNQTAFAQSDLSIETNLSEIDKRLIYSCAFEATL